MFEDQHDKGRRNGKYLSAKLTEIEKELPFHLVGAGCDFYQYHIDRPFGYSAYQWIQTISGTGILEIMDKKIPVPGGHGMLLYPGTPHIYYAIEEPWTVSWITINGYHIENMLHYIGIKKSGVFSISEPPVMEAHIRKALQILSNPSEMTGLDGSVMAYQLLIYLYKYAVNNEKENHNLNSKRLQLVMNQIEKEMRTPLSIEQLAETAGVTSQYFCEIFKASTNQRPTEYINQRRIDRAKEMIINNPLKKIGKIAAEVGFESSSYFSTVFRKQEGLSPNKYREINL
ncbi:MAG: AraC family transcriptional regulator [Spirochaetes bacterium]|nr:MAG: AraC family transcriptional regulator [Spirochaetota bacterium]